MARVKNRVFPMINPKVSLKILYHLIAKYLSHEKVFIVYESKLKELSISYAKCAFKIDQNLIREREKRWRPGNIAHWM